MAAAVKRNIRIVLLCVVVFTLGTSAVGVRFMNTQATAAATASYDVLKSARHDKTFARNDFRQALKALVRRKADALGTMQGRDIRLVLGNPQQVRRDHGVHVWQYRTDSCVLDIYMRKTGGQGAKLQAAHHDIRKRRHIKVNSSDDNKVGQNRLTAQQRSRCLTKAFRNFDPEQGGQSYASLD